MTTRNNETADESADNVFVEGGVPPPPPTPLEELRRLSQEGIHEAAETPTTSTAATPTLKANAGTGRIAILWDISSTLLDIDGLSAKERVKRARTFFNGLVYLTEECFGIKVLEPAYSQARTMLAIHSSEVRRPKPDSPLLKALSLLGFRNLCSDGKSEGEIRELSEEVGAMWDDVEVVPPSLVVVITAHKSLVDVLRANRVRDGQRACVVFVSMGEDVAAAARSCGTDVCDVATTFNEVSMRHFSAPGTPGVTGVPHPPANLTVKEKGAVGIFMDLSNIAPNNPDINGNPMMLFHAFEQFRLQIASDFFGFDIYREGKPRSCDSFLCGYTRTRGRGDVRSHIPVMEHLGFTITAGDGARGGDDRHLTLGMQKLWNAPATSGSPHPRLIVIWSQDQDFTHTLRRNRIRDGGACKVVLVRLTDLDAVHYKNRPDVCDLCYSVEEFVRRANYLARRKR